MSRAVERTSVGYHARSSGVSSGQPRVANGHSAELNQVSSTSSSLAELAVAACRSAPAARPPRSSPRRRRSSGRGAGGPTRAGARRTTAGSAPASRGRPWSRASRDGSGCPPSARPRMAGFASSVMSQNHWSEIRGSMRRPERCECGTSWVYGSSSEITFSARSAATTASRASSTSRPAKRSPAASVIRPSSPITEISSSPWRRPISKSLGSWPGVILRQPVPNSGSTCSSAITGRRRPTSGRMTSLPIRSR